MVIGFDGSRAFWEKRTGTENYSYQLLKALAKIDDKNKYLVFIRDGAVLDKFPRNFHFKTIKWPRFWTQGGLSVETFKVKLDVLFIPAHTLPVIRKPGLKTILTVHDLGSEYLPQFHQLKQRLYLGFMQKYQLNSATRIISVSKSTKLDLIERIGINQSKITVVYEGYDKELFKRQTGDILINTLIHYKLKPYSYFLFVGTVQPRKNLKRLIKAYAQYLARQPHSLARQRKRPVANRLGYALPRQNLGLAEFGGSLPVLVVVGSKGWLSDEIYKLPKKLGIEDQIKFLGYVPDEDMPALYSGAIALTFPSLFEGFGLPILEAQACGCSVITSNTSSMPEVAGKGAILVDPYDEDQITNAMIRLMEKNVRDKLIESGFRNIKKFSWEKCAKETLKILEKV